MRVLFLLLLVAVDSSAARLEKAHSLDEASVRFAGHLLAQALNATLKHFAAEFGTEAFVVLALQKCSVECGQRLVCACGQ